MSAPNLFPLPRLGLAFLSGSNHAGEIRGIYQSGRQVGVSVARRQKRSWGRLPEETYQELAAQSLDRRHALFVDSGAFGEVDVDKATGELRTVRPISDDEWDLRLTDDYDRLANWYERRCYLVAPDKIGDQAETLRRLGRFRADLRRLMEFHGANLIVVLPRGERSLGEQMVESLRVLGYHPGLVWGLPLKKNATSLPEVARFARDLTSSEYPFPRVHFLGLAPQHAAGHPGERFLSAYLAVKRFCPDALISSDSVRIKALVGRTNGPGGTPRELTAAQDRVRSFGVTDVARVKGSALRQVLGRENRQLGAIARGVRVWLSDVRNHQVVVSTVEVSIKPVQLDLFGRAA